MSDKETCPVCGQRLTPVEGVYGAILSCTNCHYDVTMSSRDVKFLARNYDAGGKI